MNLTYYTTFDLPVPYKNLMLYPVLVKDYMLFNYYSQCYLLDKNSIPDKKIISMTELEYVYYCTEQNPQETPYIVLFDRLLSLVLRDDKSFDDISKSITRYKRSENGEAYFVIGEEKFYAKDFDEIRTIICEQNEIELPDENISKEVRDSLEKAREYKRSLTGTKPATLEDYFISLSSVTGWTLEYIHSLTIRKFIKTIQRLDNYIHYRIYLTASMSGMIEFKDKSFIKHWLSSLEEKDKYGDVSVDLQSMENKISMESAKQ